MEFFESISPLLKGVIAPITFLFGFYVFLQRFHLRLQARFLKNISDEIIKINDFCIEFNFKHSQIVEKDDADQKIISETEILRSKIKNHLDYLSCQINSFPFGNPLNFFWFSLTGKYICNTFQIEIDGLVTGYQDTILENTILQSEEFICNSNNKDECITREKIDDIVVCGIELINKLEDHSKRFF